ncbi:hypothetical protein POX_d05870 [Penicillium oxalicum]|uniref:hypothetical protein n=1 Tax=Penicillium oxalicum TaxID=69781 RepID=UPI0020B651DA|nr:hypothetical protein POX_d05870 [Penicillium oxalicum]KAI2790359.1 hypothetical protein POX_d05870 [Penicillium oxalicum]
MYGWQTNPTTQTAADIYSTLDGPATYESKATCGQRPSATHTHTILPRISYTSTLGMLSGKPPLIA